MGVVSFFSRGLGLFELGVQILHVLRALYAGLLLGFMGPKHFHYLTRSHYASRRSLFQSSAFQRRGLFLWEEAVIDVYFLDCTRILLLGAGAGREIFGLSKYPFELTAFEPNEKLIEKGNQLLQQEGIGVTIRPMPENKPPELTDTYDGVIIGWGAYMHIPTRSERIALLKQILEHLEEDAPLLISVEPSHALHPLELPVAYSTGSIIRKLRRADPLQLGDYIMIREGRPAFIHLFQRGQLQRELKEVGFKTVYYDEADYCVLIAVRKTTN